MTGAGSVTDANRVAAGRLAGGRYPHLSAEDREVWLRFLSRQDLRGWTIRYDVRVGQGSRGLEGVAEEDRRTWLILASKRVDVVLERPGRGVVIEVKPVCSMSALGQVLTYRHLLKAERRPALDWSSWIVCQDADLDVTPVCVEHGVRVWCASAEALGGWWGS